MKLKFKKLSENAKVPIKEPGNAGYDLYAAEAITIQPGHRALIKTNIAMEIPPGYYGRVADRSGMAFKNGGSVIAGVIDESYRNSVGIVLHNTDTEKEIVVNVGDRPAQIVFERYHEFDFEEVSELSSSDRGLKGFGSSGGVTITENKKVPTLREVYDVIKPDDFFEDFILYCVIDWNNITTTQLLEIAGYRPLDWSPQEHAEIAKKLNIRNDYAE